MSFLAVRKIQTSLLKLCSEKPRPTACLPNKDQEAHHITCSHQLKVAEMEHLSSEQGETAKPRQLIPVNQEDTFNSYPVSKILALKQ